jgi:hypothetical protein
VRAWAAAGVDLQLLEKNDYDQAYEAPVHVGAAGIALIAFFRLKVEKMGHGYFEFGLQLSWPRAHALRNRVRPPRSFGGAPSKATPSIATLSFVRELAVFPRTTPILFDALATSDADQVFEENRDSYLLRAVPKLKSLCSPERLCEALQVQGWREALFMPTWMAPVVFAAAGDEAALDVWARENEGEAELVEALRRFVAS